MKKVCVFLAPGLEEVEGLTVVDLLRRAGAELTMVSIEPEKKVCGAHGICIEADKTFEEMEFSEQDLLVLPGGMPGTLNLKKCEKLISLLKDFQEKGRLLAAICAAPTVLGYAGLLKGKKATCYPGCEEGLMGADCQLEEVVVDGTITTSRGVGTAIPFSLALIEQLFDKEKAEEIRTSIIYRV